MPKSLYFPGHYIYNSYRLSKLYYRKLNIKSYDFIYAQGLTSWYFLNENPHDLNLISNLHGLNAYQAVADKFELLKLFLHRIPCKTIIKNSKYQISLGGFLKDILIKNGAKKSSILTIPNAIESSWLLNEISKKDTDVLKFVFIGRYERTKGLKEILKVAGKLISQYTFEFHFIGEIPENNKVINDNFIYHDIIKNSEKIRSILIDSDILVCPSYSEGMPTVILEAMASGCAIIATDVGAVGTMVNQENGWLISNINLESQIEKAMISSIIEKKKLYKKKIYSLEKVKNEFTWDDIIKKKIKILKKLLK